MNQSDSDNFLKLLSSTAELFGREVSDSVAKLYWNALAPYEFEVVQGVFSQLVKGSKFMPMISDVLKVLWAKDGRPEAEAAWAELAPSLNDERLSLVWTDEMTEAWGAALNLKTDLVAARMVFLEKYRALLLRARLEGKPVKWTPSLGFDVAGREEALRKAVELRRLTHEHAALLLPPPK